MNYEKFHLIMADINLPTIPTHDPPVITYNAKKMSLHGINHLIQWEGFETKAYGRTIGVGHLLTHKELTTGSIKINGANVSWKRGLSRKNVLDLLTQDLARFEKYINSIVKTPVTQSQFDALVSVAFNMGEGGIAKTKLLKELNSGNHSSFTKILPRYNRVKKGNKVILSKGLAIRRKGECDLWNNK